MKAMLFAALAALTVASGAQAAALPPQASIPFVNHGGIRDWHAVDTETLYVQDAHRRWYRADLLGPCFDLPFALGIGFETRGIDRFDRFSAIRVGRDRCPVSSLTPSDAPPAKRARS
jgi:hypothetical protein